jgi:hypothetical protein
VVVEMGNFLAGVILWIPVFYDYLWEISFVGELRIISGHSLQFPLQN